MVIWATSKHWTPFADLPVVFVSFEGKPINDEALSFLAEFDQLKNINLRGTRITDAALRVFTAFQNNTTIRYLTLSQTRVTSEGLSFLKGLRKLERSLKLVPKKAFNL